MAGSHQAGNKQADVAAQIGTENEKKPFRCLGCGVTLGFSDSIYLFFENIYLDREVTMRCRKCKRVRAWRPASPVKSKS